MANANDLFWVSLLLVGFALAGGAYGSFFVIGRIARSRALVGVGWAFFGLQTVAGLALLGSCSLGLGGKLFVGGSLLGFALLPSAVWALWARPEPKKGTEEDAR